MRKSLWTAFYGVLLLVLSGCANDPVNILLGNWEVDAEATADHLIESGEVSASDRASVLEQLQKRANRHTLVFDKDRLIADEIPFQFILLHSE